MGNEQSKRLQNERKHTKTGLHFLLKDESKLSRQDLTFRDTSKNCLGITH